MPLEAYRRCSAGRRAAGGRGATSRGTRICSRYHRARCLAACRGLSAAKRADSYIEGGGWLGAHAALRTRPTWRSGGGSLTRGGLPGTQASHDSPHMQCSELSAGGDSAGGGGELRAGEQTPRACAPPRPPPPAQQQTAAAAPAAPPQAAAQVLLPRRRPRCWCRGGAGRRRCGGGRRRGARGSSAGGCLGWEGGGARGWVGCSAGGGVGGRVGRRM